MGLLIMCAHYHPFFSPPVVVRLILFRFNGFGGGMVRYGLGWWGWEWSPQKARRYSWFFGGRVCVGLPTRTLPLFGVG